jgi:hypothetical protein
VTSFFRLQFLFSSFGPLFALVAIVFAVQGYLWLAGVAVLLALCAGLTFLALATGLKRKSPFHEVVQVDGALDQHILSHLIAYLPPVLVDGIGSPQKLIPVLAFYGLLLVIMLRADAIYVNPFFLWFGYRIFQVRLPNGRQIVIVTKRASTISGDRLTLYEIDATRLYFAE